jgi:DNA-binding transcriptional regulator YiaG
MKNKYESEMLQVIHEDMKGMHELGIISDARMREFDKMCLVQEPKPPYKSASSARTVRAGRISAKGAGV